MLMIPTRMCGEGNGNPLQYSCLENPMDGGPWWATVHGVAKSRTRLSDFTSQECAPTKITVTSHRKNESSVMMSYCLLNWSSASLKSRFLTMRYCVDIASFNSGWVQGHIQQQRGGRWGCVWHKLERSVCGPGTVTEEPRFVGEGGATVDAVEWRQISEEVTSSGSSFFNKNRNSKKQLIQPVCF